jgi:hypothetical protein
MFWIFSDKCLVFCVKVRQVLLFQLVIYSCHHRKSCFFSKFFSGDSILDTIFYGIQSEHRSNWTKIVTRLNTNFNYSNLALHTLIDRKNIEIGQTYKRRFFSLKEQETQAFNPNLCFSLWKLKFGGFSISFSLLRVPYYYTGYSLLSGRAFFRKFSLMLRSFFSGVLVWTTVLLMSRLLSEGNCALFWREVFQRIISLPLPSEVVLLHS